LLSRFARERALRQSINAKAAHQARLLAVKQPDEKALALVGRELDVLAGELQAEKLDQHLAAAAEAGAQLGLTEEELATRLRRAIRNLDKK